MEHAYELLCGHLNGHTKSQKLGLGGTSSGFGSRVDIQNEVEFVLDYMLMVKVLVLLGIVQLNYLIYRM
jgi:hypothetical protein